MRDDEAIDKDIEEKANELLKKRGALRRQDAEIAKLEADTALVQAQARFTHAQAALQEQTAESNKLIQQLQKLQVNKQIQKESAQEEASAN